MTKRAPIVEDSCEKIASIGAIVEAQASVAPDKVALLSDDGAVSYGELNMRANQVANGLRRLGIEPGDRVAFLGRNSTEYFEILCGVAKARAVTTPVSWRLAASEVREILNDSTAAILFIDEEFAAIVSADREALRALKIVIVVAGRGAGVDNYVAWRDSQSPTPPDTTGTLADEALQLYTSGTTGKPKGVVTDNRAIMAARKLTSKPTAPAWYRWDSDDVGLVAMPCFHIGGTGFGLNILYHGATGIVLSDFDPHRLLDLIVTHKVSKLFIVPSALQILLDRPEIGTTDFRHLKQINYGASPIPPPLMQRAMDVLGCGFVQVYGMTETSGVVAALSPEDHVARNGEKRSSVGRPLAGIDIRISDGTDGFAPIGTVGEILIRSPTLMTRYWGRPAESAEAFAAGGWYKTGDAGRLDEEGYLYIEDRVKDMIISGGENIYPAEVENAIYEHPKVAAVAVIGVPDDKWGEAVMAYVALKHGERLDEAEVIAWTRERIARFKAPKIVAFREHLPLGPSGKILRSALRAPHWKGRDRAIN